MQKGIFCRKEKKSGVDKMWIERDEVKILKIFRRLVIG